MEIIIFQRQRVGWEEHNDTICLAPQITGYVTGASENFRLVFQLND